MDAEQTNHDVPPTYPTEEHLFRLLVEKVEDYAIYLLDPDGNVVTWNTGATRLKGYKTDEILGRSFEVFFTPEARRAGRPRLLLEQATAQGRAEDEGWRQRKDGSLFWAHVSMTALYEDNGRLIGFAKVTRDRTLHREQEEKIGRLNRMYRVLSDINQAIVRTRDLKRLFEQACRIAVYKGNMRLAWIALGNPLEGPPVIVGSAGFEPEQLAQLSKVMDFEGPKPPYVLRAAETRKYVVVNDVMMVPETSEFRPVSDSLGYRSVAVLPLLVGGEVRGLLTFAAAEPFFFDAAHVRLLEELALDLAFAIDVSEREQQRQAAERALSESELRYRNLVEHAPDAIFINQEDRVVLVNQACVQMFGAGDAQQLLGRSIYDLFTPSFHAQIKERVRQLRELKEPVGALEEVIVRLDGTFADVEVNAAAFRYGSSGGIHVILRDITERKRSEKALRELNLELEERVHQRTLELEARNRELETFTYSVSHDLKAPLRGIDGYSHLLLDEYGDRLDDEGRRFISVIRRSTLHMNRLIDDLLVYYRLERRPQQPGLVDLRSLIDSVLNEFVDEAERSGVILQVAVPSITCNLDAEGLALIIRNLVDNALKFTRSVAHPEVNIGGNTEGGTLNLWVRDNGIGFDMKQHDRIFEIFQRLHRADEYPGTGLGLAIVRRAVDRMNGRVWAESQAGIGATFHVELPLEEA
jgi:PAS domain S-box-containing protein